jgi:hypothetical protein
MRTVNILIDYVLLIGIIWLSGSTNFSLQEIIKDDDEKLNGLRKEVGENAYNAVVEALTEFNEYDPSGRSVTSELWNYKAGRKATLQEGVQFLSNHCKRKKRKRAMLS